MILYICYNRPHLFANTSKSLHLKTNVWNMCNFRESYVKSQELLTKVIAFEKLQDFLIFETI